jgi:hypothetical protein
MNKHLVPMLLVLLALLPVAASADLPITVANPDFTGPESVLALVPASISVKKGGKLNAVAASQATDAMKAGAIGKIGQFKVKLKKLETTRDHGAKYFLHAEPDKLAFRGDRYEYHIRAYFGADQADELSKLREGVTVTVVGRIIRSDIAAPGDGEKFIIAMQDCHIVGR